jgi:optic atrophy 3 protein
MGDPFPLAKFGSLVLKQVSKPVANQLKNAAKNSRLFRRYVCLPTAQFYHWAETTMKMYVLGFGKPVQVAPLSEQMAVELGSEILGETIVFSIAAAALIFEYNRSATKTKAKEDKLMERLKSAEDRLMEAQARAEQQEIKIQDLRVQLARSGPLTLLKEKLAPSHQKS